MKGGPVFGSPASRPLPNLDDSRLHVGQPGRHTTPRADAPHRARLLPLPEAPTSAIDADLFGALDGSLQALSEWLCDLQDADALRSLPAPVQEALAGGPHRELQALLESLRETVAQARALKTPAQALITQAQALADILAAAQHGRRAVDLAIALNDPALVQPALEVTLGALRLVRHARRARDQSAQLTEVQRRLRSLSASLVTHARDALDAPTAMSIATYLWREKTAAQPVPSELREAFSAMCSPQRSEAERRKAYAKAQGEPLLIASTQALSNLQQLGITAPLHQLGLGLDLTVRDQDGGTRPWLQKSALAFLGELQFAKLVDQAVHTLDSIDSPKGQAQLDAALNVVRVAARVERDNLAKIAVDVPKEHRERVLRGLGRYAQSIAQLCLEEANDAATQELYSLVEQLLREAAGLLTSFEQPADAPEASTARLATSMGDYGRERLCALADRPQQTRARLDSINAKLKDDLQGIELSPNTVEATQDILQDLVQSTRIAANLVTLFGAISNDRMPPQERAQAIRSAVETMGPIFVKIMQTAINMEQLFRLTRGDEQADTPVLEALRSLQDDVTPVSFGAVRAQVESSLGMPIEQAFASFEQQPIASGSIGQTHLATLQTEEGPQEVIVKVRRPGLDEDFDNTVRVTRLALAVTTEILSLDYEIFASAREVAQRYLPMIQRALESFVESFRVETDFLQEAQTMARFDRMLSTHPYITIPEVYESHSTDSVLTMQRFKGFKLSEWIQRYEYAQDKPTPPQLLGPLRGPTAAQLKEAQTRARAWLEDIVPRETLRSATVTAWSKVRGFGVKIELPGASPVLLHVGLDGSIRARPGSLPHQSRHSAITRGRAYIERTWGLDVKRLEAHRTHRGYLVIAEMQGGLLERAEVFIDYQTGEMQLRSAAPDLSARALEALRDRLISSFLFQLISGLIHGDPHEGNFFVLPDGKTIGLIDFGLSLDLQRSQLISPASLAMGVLFEDPAMMAQAVVEMSDAKEPDAHLPLLTERFEALLAKDNPRAGLTGLLSRAERLPQSMEPIAQIALKEAGLNLSPIFLQLLKASLAMAGNAAQLLREDLSPRYGRLLGKTAADFTKYQVTKSTPMSLLALRQRAQKSSRVRALERAMAVTIERRRKTG